MVRPDVVQRKRLSVNGELRRATLRVGRRA